LPLTALSSDHVRGNEGVIPNPAKRYFYRPRPYDFDPTLKPVCKTTTNPAEALVLTMILPEKRDAILARADDYAYSRLICGVHYLTDVVASRSVAYAMIGIIANDPVFRKEFEAAKAETRRALDF
jgi:acid phosphatase (class A)